MLNHFHRLEFASNDLSNVLAVRLRHGQVNQFPVNLMSIVSTPRQIDELIKNNERARLNPLSETADYARPDHLLNADRFQRREIRLVGNLVRRNRMLHSVSGQKSDTPAAQFADDDWSRRLTVRRFHLDGFSNRQFRQSAETRPADDSKKRILLGGERLLVLSVRESR